MRIARILATSVAVMALAAFTFGQSPSSNSSVPGRKSGTSASSVSANSGIQGPGKAIGAGAGSANINKRANAGYLSQGHFSAPVPQYWITDAMIFIGNAAHAARVASMENTSDIQYLPPFKNQGKYIVNCVARSINDIAALNRNALKTNPEAVPKLRDALAELQAAYGQLQAFTNTAGRLNLGPTYKVTVLSVVAHLDSADRFMPSIARDYNMNKVVSQLHQMEASAPPE